MNYGTENQDLHILTQKTESILQITPFKLKIEASALHFHNVNA